MDVFTDGACLGNPGPGGWGVVILKDGSTMELCGGEARTTNNRMELFAAIAALGELKQPSKIAMYTDSAYLKRGMTEWLPRWKNHDWRLVSGKGEVKNKDLWVQLDQLCGQHEVVWYWLKGHCGYALNERADQLARACAKKYIRKEQEAL